MLDRLVDLLRTAKRRPTFADQGVVHRVEVQTWVRCICGAAEDILLPSIGSRVRCPRCQRVYGVRSLVYTQMSAIPDRDAKVHVTVGYFVPSDELSKMTPVGQLQ